MSRLGRALPGLTSYRGPVVVGAPAGPTRQQQTVGVTLAAHARRSWNRRFPPQCYEGSDTQDTRGQPYQLAQRCLGPVPPQQVTFPPNQQQQTIGVHLAADLPRRTTSNRFASHSRLAKPTVVVLPLAPPIETTLVSLGAPFRQRRTFALSSKSPVGPAICAILDEFNRPTTLSGPESTNWAPYTNAEFNISNHQARGAGGDYWAAQQFGPDQQVQIRQGAKVASGAFTLLARFQWPSDFASFGQDARFYGLSWIPPFATLVYQEGSNQTNLASGASSSVVGDIWLFTVVGTTLSAYKNGVLVVSTTDSRIGSGYIGFDISDQNDLFDDFGGGNFGDLATLPGWNNYLGPRHPTSINVAPLAPNQQQQTLTVHTAVSGRRYTEARRFPLQGWKGITECESNTPLPLGISTGFGSTTAIQFGTVSAPARAQPFLATSVRISSVVIRINKQGAPTDNLYLTIQPDKGGLPDSPIFGTSSLVPASSVSSTFTDVTFTFPTPVDAPANFWVVIQRDGAGDNLNFFNIRRTENVLGAGSAVFDGSIWDTTLQTLFMSISGTTSPGRGAISRFLGPRPPLVINPLPTQQQTAVEVRSLTQAVIRREQAQLRAPKSLLFPPASAPRPPPVVTTILAKIVQTRPRPTTHRYLAPYVFPSTSDIAVTLVKTRPRPTTHVLSEPTALQTFATAKAALTQNRPRHTRSLLTPPTVVRVPSVEQQEQTVRVLLTCTRPRPITSTLQPPAVGVAGQVYYTFPPKIVQTRPRPTVAFFIAPVTYPATSEITVTNVKTRPRKTRWFLGSPTVLQTFQAEVAPLVKTRPRHTISKIAPPTVVRVPSVEQREQTIAAALIRTRPRPTTKALFPPTVLQEFFGPVEHEIAIRIPVEDKRRGSHYRLSPPQVVRVPSVEQREQTVSVTLVRSRPRPTTRVLAEPTTLQVFPGPVVVLARIRPRPTTRFLSEPTVLQTFAGPEVFTTRIRPRPTVKTIGEPTVVRVPSVEQQEDTIRVTLARTRPRPTTRLLGEPTVLQTFVGPFVSLTRIKQRPTTKTIFEPTKLLVPSVEERLRKIQVAVVHTRPRPTVKTVEPPTAVSRPPVGSIAAELVALRTRYEWKRHFPLQGWRQRLIRETGAAVGVGLQGFDPFLGPRPPQIIDPLPTQREQTIKVTVALRPRVETQRRLARYRLAPPTKIIPLPTQQMQTVTVVDVSVRTRVEQQRHAPHSRLTNISYSARSRIGVTTALRTRLEQQRRAARYKLSPPTVVARAAFFGPDVTLVKTRPRPTTRFFVETPITQVFTAPETPPARTRPRPTTRFLLPPTIVRVPSVEQQLRTIRVALVETRPRPTVKTLAEPTALRIFQAAKVTLATIRPRPTRRFLRPPTVIRVPSVEQAEDTIRVTLVRARPRPTRPILRQPVPTPPVVTTVKVALAAIRPQRTHPRLLPLPVTVPARVVEETIRVALVQPTGFRRVRSTLQPPTVVSRPSQRDQTITTHLVQTRPRTTVAVVTPPAVVKAPPTQTQQTIRVLLAGETRLRIPAVHQRLPKPTVLVIPRVGVTYGEDVAATSVDDTNVADTAVSDQDQVAATAGEITDSAAVSSTIEDVAATTVESKDQEAGT